MKLAKHCFLALSASVCCLLLVAGAIASTPRNLKFEIVQTPTDGGIREDVSDKYRPKFERWKAALVSTEFGRQQWERYANNKNFVLTIKVTRSRGKGAGTDGFRWDQEGRLVGATITLGSEIEQGYPTPIYYPVLNSLSAAQAAHAANGDILAATKMSHEIGHVTQTENANAKLLETQSRLIPVYTSIFLKNGFNLRDEKLIELAGKIGGTPTEIWEDREYWSEVNAMRFLQERIKGEDFYCVVFEQIKQNVETYARAYRNRFASVASTCAK